jgi:hypothetical protein
MIIDVGDNEKNGLARSATSIVKSNPAPVVRGDGEIVQIFPVTKTGETLSPWSSVDWSSSAITLSVGLPGEKPTGGTYTVTYGGNETGEIAFDATPAEVQATLNTLASIISAGLVTVTGIEGDYYAIEFNATDVRTEFTGDPSSLTPFGETIFDVLVEGDGSTKEIVALRLRAQILAISTNFSAVAAIEGVVDIISAGDPITRPIQKFGFSREATGGTFRIIFDGKRSSSLPYNATSDEVRFSMGTTGGLFRFDVSGPQGGPWTLERLEFGEVEEGSMETNGIDALDGWETEINYATREMFLTLVELQRNEVKKLIEIEVTPSGGLPQTVYQSEILIKKDVIDSGILTSIFAQLGAPLVIPKDITTQTHTFGLSDMNCILMGTHADAKTWTVPPESAVAFPLGAAIAIYQDAVTQVTVAAGAGVTVRTSDTLLTRKQYSSVLLIKLRSDEWLLTGDIDYA